MTDINPEGFYRSPDPLCVCGPLYTYGGHIEPGGYAEDCPIHGNPKDFYDEAMRLRAGIEALHRPVLPVFSWQSGLRFDEPCPECHGKAGVHSCGCWSDEDAEFVCFECSRPSSGYLRRGISWPCETAALLDPTEGETDDR